MIFYSNLVQSKRLVKVYLMFIFDNNDLSNCTKFFFFEEVNTRKTPCCNKISCCNKLKIFATNTYCNEKTSLPIIAINSVAIGYHKKILVIIVFCRNKEKNQGNKCRARDDAARYPKPETQNSKPQTANTRGQGLGVWGIGFQGLGFRVRVQGLGFQGLGFQGLRFSFFVEE